MRTDCFDVLQTVGAVAAALTAGALEQSTEVPLDDGEQARRFLAGRGAVTAAA